MRVIVKIGTSSVTAQEGEVDTLALTKLTNDVISARRAGHEVVLVTSGAITAGVQRLGIARPTEPERLQAVSAVGQIDLMRVYSELLGRQGVVPGQVLLAPHDFRDRNQYLHAKATFEHLLQLGVLPVVNENDAVADDAIRYGDNDRIAALVANLLRADLMVLLTDTVGVLTDDPRVNPEASLIEEIREVDHSVEGLAGAAGERGSGGMSSKLAAAKMASWSGVRTVIAAATRPGVLGDAIAAEPGIGTAIPARDAHVSARKLWIGFAVTAEGLVKVDEGARRALLERGRSLLPAGVIDVEGPFDADDAVEIAGPEGRVFAKGLVGLDSDALTAAMGRRTDDLAPGTPSTVVHADDLVLLP
ncbi:MAG: glutamate 5-kinase [Actinomycetota bacterium]|jgi:glutamate 5-kinase|nr:glutamate 5-kinase [Actinomycetota bacterium]